MSTRSLQRWLLFGALGLLALGAALWARYGTEVFLRGLGPLFCS
jgi:hypothetical protein